MQGLLRHEGIVLFINVWVILYCSLFYVFGLQYSWHSEIVTDWQFLFKIRQSIGVMYTTIDFRQLLKEVAERAQNRNQSNCRRTIGP